MSLGPVCPRSSERLALEPLIAGGAVLSGGFWGHRQAQNRALTIPYGMARLEESGTIENLRIAAGTSRSEYNSPLFRDSDLYKVLEAIAWERAHGPDAEQERFFASSVAAIGAAQQPDGYLNSYVQVVTHRPFADPATGHELYCAGHLMQAAVADVRTAGEATTLLGVAGRFAAMLATALRGEQAGFVGGHPEIETALVELYRTTGEHEQLELAGELLARRGQAGLRWNNRGPAYFQDDVPFAEARSIRGHAVRALYLLAGGADLYTEIGGETLLAASLAQWADMTSGKTYLTGGVGSRHLDEAFGDPFELPPDRAYCETCAAIASVMWNWRLLLLTGEARFAELIERTLYNGFLAGVGLDGTSFFYVNPLQARLPAGRSAWYDCACCPPNAMRLLASLEHYLATRTSDGLQLHQYATGRFRADAPATSGSADPGGGPRSDGGASSLRRPRSPGGPGTPTPAGDPGSRAHGGPVALEVAVETDFPISESIGVTVLAAWDQPFELALRIPSWAVDASAALNGTPTAPPVPGEYLRLRRRWRAGDEIVLELPMRGRTVRASEDVDATRGCVAFERGPLVYCLEGRDVPERAGLRGVEVIAGAPARDGRRPLEIAGQQVVPLELDGRVRLDDAPPWPYRQAAPSEPAGDAEGAGERQPPTEHSRRVRLTAVPYFAWANRGPSEMRVWIPESR